MVDAQAPGVAGAVRRAAGVIGRGHGWPGELLEELSLIHLIVSAHDRLAELPPSLADTVQSRIGWTVETARVLAEGEKVEDDWLVLGRVIEPDERLTVRRVWLRGATTGRLGLILTFAAAGRPLDPLPARPGEYVPGALSFYPGALPMRALLTQTAPRLPAPRPSGSHRAPGVGVVRRIRRSRPVERTLAARPAGRPTCSVRRGLGARGHGR